MKFLVPARFRNREKTFYAICGLCVFLLIVVILNRRHAKSKEEVFAATMRRIEQLNEHKQGYELVNETAVYMRYAMVYNRVLKFPDGNVFSFDIWGRNWKKDSFGVVIIVPYDSKTKSFTLVKEYSVAHDRFVYGFPTGMIDLDKHSSPLDAAEQELDEEAHLTCNKLINLLAPMAEHGVPQDKYQRERVYMYLCVDEEKDIDPGIRDSEESDLYIETGVTAPEVKALARRGFFQSNNVAAAYMAFDELQKQGYRIG